MAGVGGSSSAVWAGGRALVAGMVLLALAFGLLIGQALGTVGGVTAQQSGGSGSGEASTGSSGSGAQQGTGAQGGTGEGDRAPDDGSSGSSGSSGTSPDDGGDEGGGDGGPGTTAGGGTATTGPTASTAPTTTESAAPTTAPSPPPDSAPSRETACPDDVPASPSGGEVRCYELTGDEEDPNLVVVPGIPVPLPIPAPVLVPVGGDTGDSNSTYVDRRTTVYVDVDNQVVVDGDTRTGTRSQRIAATIALLVLIPVVVALVATAVGQRRRSGGATQS